MSWLFYALLSPAVLTIVNFGDKYIVEHEVRDARAMPIYAAIMAFITGAVLWVLTGFPILDGRDTVLVLLTGALSSWGSALYFRALSYEEASKIIVLLQMRPMMVLVLSLIFLNEVITPEQLLGFVLILGAAVGISLNRSDIGGFKLSRAFWMLLIVDLMWSVSIVLFKFVVSASQFEKVLSWQSWGIALGGLTLYLFVPLFRHAFNRNVVTVRRRAFGLVFVNETTFVVANLLGFMAVALGPVALVSVLGSTQIFFGIVLGWLLTTLAPTKFRENVTREGLLTKAALALMLFGGIVLVY